ncbi:class D sortase [Terrilactibacillus laevilacticus]|uniref:class D sortase n=1 Tax=Terrilactibacillus laevilacticus TaxID=1380157 RepID=UPI001FE5F1E4|nr:class D sortase [Terrilactibacillus laevilacticus]
MKNKALILCILGAGIMLYAGFQMLSTRYHERVTLNHIQSSLSQSKTKNVTLGSYAPKKGDGFATLTIPKLKKVLPIVEGANPDDLAKGVGHVAGTSFPAMHDQIVLSGHRDTVFRHVGELKKGDSLIVMLDYGEFKYIIQRMKIVSSEDTSIIHSTKPHEELVLTTCYPFSYIGNAPKRYIIYAIPDQE